MWRVTTWRVYLTCTVLLPSGEELIGRARATPSPDGRMKNLLENALTNAYIDLRARNPEFCGCDRCREDVLAYALNKMRPRYSSGGDLGVALANLDLQRGDARANIAVTLMEGMRRVGTNPHRQQDGMGRREGGGP